MSQLFSKKKKINFIPKVTFNTFNFKAYVIFMLPIFINTTIVHVHISVLKSYLTNNICLFSFPSIEIKIVKL